MALPTANAYGVDVDTSGGVPRRWNLCSGPRNVGNSIARRLSTTPGSLKADPNYGLNLRFWLNAGYNEAQAAQLRSLIAAEAAKEETVESIQSVALLFNAARESMIVTLVPVLDTGPFTLVLSVDKVSVQVLRQGQGAITTTGGAAAGASANVVEVIAGQPGRDGRPGGAGPPGPAGPAGSGAPIITLPSTLEEHSSVGAEELIDAFVFSLDASLLTGATLAVSATLQALSAAGTATIRLRVGGSYNALDGTVIDTKTVNATSYIDLKLSGSITNPTGQVPVKITIESSAPDVDAAVYKPTVSVSG